MAAIDPEEPSAVLILLRQSCRRTSQAKARRAMMRQYRRLFRIGRANRDRGFPTLSFAKRN
jgi:hypothetical protein